MTMYFPNPFIMLCYKGTTLYAVSDKDVIMVKCLLHWFAKRYLFTMTKASKSCEPIKSINKTNLSNTHLHRLV